MKKSKLFKLLCLVLSIAVVILVVVLLNGSEEENSQNAVSFEGITEYGYKELYKDVEMGTDVHVLDATKFYEKSGDVSVVKNPDNTRDEDVILTGDEATVTYQIDIETAGLYCLQLDYMPAEGNGNEIERNILIDGKIPYDDAEFVTFTRIWQDTEEIRQDINGNDIKPRQAEVSEWKTTYVYDSLRYYNEPLMFYLSEGSHTIGLESVREPMYISSITVKPWEVLKSYSEVKAEYEANGYNAVSVEPIKIQAENMYQKSDYTLYQTSDRTSALTEPQDPAQVKLNQIGGDKFKLVGQWVTWEVEVPEDGLYEIALRYKQNLLSGMYTTRTLLIDGEIPFEEATKLQFNFSNEWQTKALGNGEENYQFYLTAGKHQLSMEVTLGNMAAVLAEVQNCLVELNEIYREILLITGAEADIYRDYNFDRSIPDTIANMKVQADVLAELSNYLEAMVGSKGEQVVILDKINMQLETMYNEPSQIARNFTAYKDNIATLASWIVTVSEQPLSLDYIMLTAPGEKLPKGEAGFFQAMGYEFQSFVMSFFTDYDTLGLTVDYEEAKQDSVEVWITAGRDQANVIRQMINAYFTPQTGINVDLKLVNAGTLLPAVLSGQGPDVALGNALSDPIQYALRNAVLDLSQFETYDEVTERFHESAMVSYTFNGAVYAIPETQTFPMLFYRKDIFEEFGLSVPNTWDEFFEVVSVLQSNNLEVGFPNGMGGMQIFLYQNGGSLYNEDLSACSLAEDRTLDAFQSMLDLFTTYKFPRDYDFANRFKSGQMPLAIQDYTVFNNLAAFAPEIKGEWGMAPIPGTVEEDGSINRAAACGGTCAMMLRGTEDPEKAWEFMSWWTTAEIQAEYAQEMKAILGDSAMHATANMEAISRMPWTKEEYTALYEQWSHIVGTPEVPGNYYVTRNIGFASVAGYDTGNAEELLDWLEETNEEITRKRKEFGLE